MSKVKYINQTTRVSKISRTKIFEVVKFAHSDYEPYFNWLPAGSQKRYRENCNKARYELQCEYDPESKRSVFQHCGKLDCEKCFITTSSLKARKINERLMEFRRICYANKIAIDKILHFSILLRKGKDLFQTHADFSKFKRNRLYPMLKAMGVIGGVMFLHIWSNICKMCGEKEYYCRCNEEVRIFEKRINIHVHVLGFGYLMNSREFKEKYENCLYRNHLPRRSNAYYTLFYVFSKIALWKGTKKIKDSCTYFGFLHPSKFKIMARSKTKLMDNCPQCDTPRHISMIENKKLDHKVYWETKVQHRRYKIVGIDILRDLVKELYKGREKKILRD